MDNNLVARIVRAARNPETVAPRNGHKESDTEWAERAVGYVLDDPTVDRLTPEERAQHTELVAAARATVDAINKLHADFVEAHADGASSNDIAQLLDDFLVGQGLPTVLYA